MRTIKPIRLGVLHRVLELGRKPHLIVTVFAAMKIGGEKELVPEFTLWKLVEKSIGTGTILDEGYSKPAGELVVHGHFHAPHGKPEPVSFAGVEISRDNAKLIEKRVAILGRREWRSGVPTNPEPVDTLKLDWTNAFGGDEHPTNPLGRGMKPKDDTAPWLLPQIEDPKHLIRAPGDRPRPAGFGPLDLGSIERRELAGNYGGDYLETRFPGPAADMDPRFFHTAREDQRISGFFRGGERIAFVNMHPKHSRLEAVLPAHVGRAFIQRGERTNLIEIPLRIDTIIAFPTDELLVAVHRAMVPVDEDDASDITTLVLGAEDPSMPRTVDHYKSVMTKRTDRENHGALWALQDEDLMPQREAGWGSARMPEDDLTLLAKTDDLLLKRSAAKREHALASKRQEMQARGHDPSVLPVPPAEAPPPSLDDVPALVEYVEKLAKRNEEEKAKGEALKAELLKKGRDAAESAGRPWEWEASVAQLRREASGPPKTPRQMFDRMKDQMTLARNAGVAIPGAAFEEDSEFFRLAEEQYKQLLDGYRTSVHWRDAAERLDAEASAKVRERFVAARAAGKRPQDVDGTGADLSKLDLSGMDLSGALLECADLTDTVLDGANLDSAVLTRAKLSRTRFRAANLSNANLGDATLSDVDFSEAKLNKALFPKSRIDKAAFVGADLADVNFFEASFGSVDFSKAKLPRIPFIKSDLKNARFAAADLEKSQFVECDLSGVDLADAKLDGVVFYKTRADGAVFTRASMKKMAWPSEVTAVNADLREAKIELACLRGANLRNTDFTGASLLQCDLGNADLTDAKLTGVDARATLFIRANMTRLNARGASFIEAILSNAILAGADFSKANMFRAVLSRARGDDKTRFTGANVEVVLHEPRYDAKTKEAAQ